MSETQSTGQSERESHDQGPSPDWGLVLNDPRTYSFILLDPAGQIVSWSAGSHTLHGYSEKEILGKFIGELSGAEHNRAGEPARLLERARAEGHLTEELWRIRKDGSSFCTKVALTALHSDGGDLRGFAEIAFDVTEQKCEEDKVAGNTRKENRAGRITRKCIALS